MQFLNDKYITWGYYFGIFLLFSGLMFSYFFVSVSVGWLLGFWILEGNYKEKWKRISNDKALIVFISVFFIYSLSLLWTKNFDFGLKDWFIKTSILALPIAMTSTFWEKQKTHYFVIATFILFTFLKSINFLIFKFWNLPDDSFWYPEISHILFSVILNVSIVIAYFLIVNSKNYLVKTILFFYIIQAIFSIFFIKSITGIIIWLILFIVLNIIFLFKHHKEVFTYIVLIFTSTLMVLFIKKAYREYRLYFDIEEINYSQLPVKTPNGNYYFHDTTDKSLEEGRYVMIFICEQELRQQWSKLSKIDYDTGRDAKGYYIKYTLFRYMTSKNLTKDSVGLQQMTDKDILNVEKGITNYRFTNKYSFDEWFNKIFWQIYNYKTTNNPNNQSISQRIEYLKASKHLIFENWLLGTGIGDIRDDFNRTFEQQKSLLLPQNRKYVHNQFITYWVTFGLILGSFTIFAFFYPFFKNKKYKQLSASMVFIALFLYCLSDNPFDRTPNTIFFVFFYALFILNKNINYDKSTITQPS